MDSALGMCTFQHLTLGPIMDEKFCHLLGGQVPGSSESCWLARKITGSSAHKRWDITVVEICAGGENAGCYK